MTDRTDTIPPGDPTAGLLAFLLEARAGQGFELTIGPLRIAGIYGGQTATVRKPGLTEMAPVLVVPDCSCGGPDDHDPECFRHGTRGPEEEEVYALLPAAVEAMRHGYGPWRLEDRRMTGEENQLCNVIARVLEEQSRPTAVPADGSAIEWPPPMYLAAQERHTQEAIRQGFRDAVDIVLRALGQLQAEGATFEEAAERIRGALKQEPQEPAESSVSTTEPYAEITVVDVETQAPERDWRLVISHQGKIHATLQSGATAEDVARLLSVTGLTAPPERPIGVA